MKSILQIFSGTSLVAIALCIMLVSNLFDLSRARTELEALQTQQQDLLAKADKFDDQLDALARGTQDLANGGNKNAQRVLAMLRQNGVNINAPAEQAAPGK